MYSAHTKDLSMRKKAHKLEVWHINKRKNQSKPPNQVWLISTLKRELSISSSSKLIMATCLSRALTQRTDWDGGSTTLGATAKMESCPQDSCQAQRNRICLGGTQGPRKGQSGRMGEALPSACGLLQRSRQLLRTSRNRRPPKPAIWLV